MLPMVEQNGSFRRQTRFIPLRLFAETEFCSVATTARCMPWMAIPARRYGRLPVRPRCGLRRWSATESFFLAAPTHTCTRSKPRREGHDGRRNWAAGSIQPPSPQKSSFMLVVVTAKSTVSTSPPAKFCGALPREMALTHRQPWSRTYFLSDLKIFSFTRWMSTAV